LRKPEFQPPPYNELVRTLARRMSALGGVALAGERAQGESRGRVQARDWPAAQRRVVSALGVDNYTNPSPPIRLQG
jgi:hypothetical protein